VKNINLLLQVRQICVTIGESLCYLSEHPDNAQAAADINAGMQAIEPHVDAGIMRRLQAMLSHAAAAGPEQMNKEVRDFLDALSLIPALSAELDSVKYIDRETAEQLYQYLDAIPRSTAGAQELLFKVCLKSSVSAPMEAFQHALGLFEGNPAILSGKNQAHPGYVYQPSEQETFDKCPVCGKEGVPYYCALSYRMVNFSNPHLPVKLWMRCGGCGNLYSWKFPKGHLVQPTRCELLPPNPDNYLTSIRPVAAASLAIWSGILNKLRTYTEKDTLLEVGIGHGELLAVALEMGYDVEAVEIERGPAQETADTLKLPIWLGNFLDFAPGKTYSVITMGDVIEHVADPPAALKNAYRLLDDDGVLWLSTPNYESSFSQMLKFDDPMWCEPYHISYFSRAGFCALAERCGFIVREYCVSQRYNGSMEMILTKRRGGD